VNVIQLLPLCVSLIVCGFCGMLTVFAVDIMYDSFKEGKTQYPIFGLFFGFLMMIFTLAIFIGALSVVFSVVT